MPTMPFPVPKKQVPPHKRCTFFICRRDQSGVLHRKRNALVSILLRIIPWHPPHQTPKKNSPETALPSRWFSGAFDHMLIWSIQSVATCKRVVPSLPWKFLVISSGEILTKPSAFEASFKRKICGVKMELEVYPWRLTWNIITQVWFRSCSFRSFLQWMDL